jgi:hypothetical protein
MSAVVTVTNKGRKGLRLIVNAPCKSLAAVKARRYATLHQLNKLFKVKATA